jgi:hypothetical protein
LTGKSLKITLNGIYRGDALESMVKRKLAPSAIVTDPPDNTKDKGRARRKAIFARAKKLGIYDQIVADAKKNLADSGRRAGYRYGAPELP